MTSWSFCLKVAAGAIFGYESIASSRSSAVAPEEKWQRPKALEKVQVCQIQPSSFYIAFFSYNLLKVIPINHALQERPPAAAGEAAAEDLEDRASAAGHRAEAAEVHSIAGGWARCCLLVAIESHVNPQQRRRDPSLEQRGPFLRAPAWRRVRLGRSPKASLASVFVRP